MTVAELVEAERSLSSTLEAFAGKWVAVVDHQVIASDDSLEGLLANVEEAQLAVATIFQVPKDHGAACFF